jgi:hypothetical protein
MKRLQDMIAQTLPLLVASLVAVASSGSANTEPEEPVRQPVVPAPDTGTFHHRALWMENPSREIVLSWTTRTAGEDHRVYFDTVSRGGDLEAYSGRQTTFKDGAYSFIDEDKPWAKPAFYHHAHLSGLEPSTTYYVVFASGTDKSREFHFTTAPEDDRPFSLLFGGDSRIGTVEPYDHTDRQKMNERMRTLFEENPDVLALAHGGDYCMKAEWRYIEPWLTDHELTTTKDGRLLPIIPTRGNHDRGVVFEEMFPWPGHEGGYYYRTQISAEMAIVVLNTEISLAGDQRDWLEATLKETRPANRWVLAMYHRPSFSSVRDVQDGAGRRNNWVPFFEEYNVDLVMESHDHALKRTLPIRASAPDLKTGIVYIGDGGLGVPQRTPDPTRWWLQSPGFTKPAHHVHILRFGGEELRVTAHGMEGDVLDDFALTPREVAVGQ